MTPTEVALLGFVAWALILLMSLGTVRTMAVVRGERAPNSFSPAGEDMDAFGKRLTRAHANCYENLPLVGAVLLYAIATNKTGVTDGLAYVFLAARIAQSVTHLVSTSNMFVRVRFFLFALQLAIMVYWLLRLFRIV